MTRIRLSMVSLLAVFAISAVASASASAEVHWWVENNARTGSEPLAAGKKAEFSEFLKIVDSLNPNKIVIKEITIKCEELSFWPGKEQVEPTESFIEGGNGGTIKGLQFSECKVTTPATGCKLAGANPDDITTARELRLALKEEGGGGKAFVTFTPIATKEDEELKRTPPFAEFTFENVAGCKTLKGLTVKVSGETKAEIKNPTVCKFNEESQFQGHNLLINEKPSKLKAAGAAVEEFVLEIETEGLEKVQEHTSESDICWDAK